MGTKIEIFFLLRECFWDFFMFSRYFGGFCFVFNKFSINFAAEKNNIWCLSSVGWMANYKKKIKHNDEKNKNARVSRLHHHCSCHDRR